MFCPNCRSKYQKKLEICTKCGVKLEENIKNENIRCSYCGVLVSSSASKCNNCGELLNKSESSKLSDKLKLISDIPQDLKKFKWDDRFVRSNLIIIVGIMGTVVIMMLIMNT